jgi:hypothetical protein
VEEISGTLKRGALNGRWASQFEIQDRQKPKSTFWISRRLGVFP